MQRAEIYREKGREAYRAGIVRIAIAEPRGWQQKAERAGYDEARAAWKAANPGADELEAMAEKNRQFCMRALAMTELQVIKSARGQYRAAFRQMANGGTWTLSRGVSGVVLHMDGEGRADAAPLVRNVQALSEEAMVNALSVAWRAQTTERKQ